MDHHRTLQGLSLDRSWLTVGVFDGLHRGHQDLVKRLVSGAHAAGAPAVVLTFFPHPSVVLGRQDNFAYLTLPEEKAALLGALGVDRVVTLPFTPELASRSAEDFMQDVAGSLGVEQLVIGYDFALGRNRTGNAARLTELGATLGYRTEVVPPFQLHGQVISSSSIRAQIQAGQVSEAAEGLGRPYRLGGPVIHGDGRGRHIHVPTANIAFPPEKLVPAYGIYATWAWLDGQRFPAATNLGINPTFTPERTNSSLETHLLDFHGDLYGRELSLDFVARLRGEEKFASVEALLAQITVDIARTREVLG